MAQRQGALLLLRRGMAVCSRCSAGGSAGALAGSEGAAQQAWRALGRGGCGAQRAWSSLRAAPGRDAAGAWRSFASRLHATLAAEANGAAGAAAGAAAASAGAAAAAGPPGAALAAGVPDAARRAMAWWLGGCTAWVFAMVVIGGVTRLTRSGLSMTDWKFTGERPPLTQADWEAEFEKYKQSPEFRLAHSHMGVEDFKFIFWWEYGHRMWGRVLGLVFALPTAAFAVKGAVNGPLAGRLGLLFAMGGAQGLVGWWMVRSGLEEPEDRHAVPRVSPYRLAAHLTSAFAIYATLAWTTLTLAAPASALAAAPPAAAAAAAALRRRALPLAALVGVTAVSGAFVAGKDAGRAFNTFPKMNGQWVPDDYFSGLPPLRNAFENTAAVQLHHRALALTTLAAVAALFASSRGAPLPAAPRRWLAALAAATGAQVALGITTLLLHVPVPLGAAHQAGAMLVFASALGLLHSVRPAAASRAARAVSRAAPPLGLAATAAVGYAVTQMK
ncbi:hypothetical protein Rsub_06718 [Raphidocelis subcapitata]|uniref:Uncharacterized protein n=1 Tax=Raphidocelis subcapitata TaxID=307507 RepID=A0A2V0P9M6_9CHLO|nr:hypothetical protein Rsub_06718 [Raphidocelis subcapitata]|eukprot:GBF94603.1 hypothetical protein Rsub_06718 [Raphidocelis subcapitata]